MELFSRTFDISHYNTAWDIFNKLKKVDKDAKFPTIKSNRIYGVAFEWNKMQNYPFVKE